jgi:multidrug transporter EmrE-like cation transporter
MQCKRGTLQPAASTDPVQAGRCDSFSDERRPRHGATGVNRLCRRRRPDETLRRLRPALPSVAVAALFVGGAVLLARAIQTDQLATIYVVGLGLEAIITVGLGVAVFGEHLTVPHTAGLILIGVGVATIRLG